MVSSPSNLVLAFFLFLVLLPSSVRAFGAGSELYCVSGSFYTRSADTFADIASISAVEGKNWRHGDIEDVLKTVACISGHKWTSMMIKRVYFG